MDTALSNRPGGAAIKTLHDNVQSLPLEERAAFLRSQAYEDHRDDLDFELRDAQGISDDSDCQPTRLAHIEAARPYGVRKAIIDQVASAHAQLSCSGIERCWKEYRRMVDRLNNDLMSGTPNHDA